MTPVKQTSNWFTDFGTQCFLYRAYKPLFYYGKLFGQIYLSTGSGSHMFFFIYCCLVCLMLFSATIRVLFYFDSKFLLNAEHMTKIMTLCYHFWAAVSHMFVLRAQNKIAPVFHHLNETIDAGGQPAYASKLYKFNIIMVIFCFICSISNGILIPLINLGVIELPFYPSFVNHERSLIWIDGLITFFVQNGVTFCMCFYVSLCYLVYLNSQQLRQRICGDMTRPVEEFFVHFHEVSSCCGVIENCFGSVIFFWFTMSIPMACSVLYVLFKAEVNPSETTLLVFWFVITTFQLLFVAIPAILVHDEGELMLCAAYTMYRNRSPGMTREEKEEARFLAQQVLSLKLSISANGFFVITRSLMITIFSAVATYFVIILQFDISQPNDELRGNFTA